MTQGLWLAVVFAVGYLFGSIPSGYLFGRWLAGVDLRQYGSGSTGATNTMRVLGARGFALTFVADALKAAAAILIYLTRYVSLGSIAGTVIGLVVTLAAVAQGLLPGALAVFAVTTAVLVIAQHRGNIARLLAGTERKIGQGA